VIGTLGKSPTTAQISAATSDLKSAWSVAVCCFVLDYVGLFGGITIFFRSLNFSHCVLHFLGALYTCWFVLDTWNYAMYWKICGLFSILPALLELGALANVFIFKTVPY